jgi:acyl-CoA dehydrogenase
MARATASPAADVSAFACFDPGILALPLYRPDHVTAAARIGAWSQANAHLWEQRDGSTPEETGRRILRALGDGGWLTHLDPRRATECPHPGDCRSACLIRQALAYADDLADYAFSIQALSAMPICRFGSDVQRQRYLPGIAAGELIASFAISEEAAGTDVAKLAMRADRSGDGYVLNGTKVWIANGSIADVHCVLARTGEGPGALGLTAFLAPATTPGVRVLETIPVIAPRAFARLAFEDCHLPADSVLGTPGGGFVIAMDMLDRFRATVGAAALGFARRAAGAALARAKDRQIYDGHLFDLQLVRAALADSEVKLSAAALLVARAAWEIDHESRRLAVHSSTAKLYATEAAQQIVDTAVQIFGAAGLVAGSMPERLYRQVRSMRIYEGASEVQKMIIADSLSLRRPGQPR